MNAIEIERGFVDEVLNGRNFDRFDDYIAADFIDHAARPGQGPGGAGYKETLLAFLDAYPDYAWTIERATGDDEFAFAQGFGKGTFTKAFGGMEPTGKTFEILEMHNVRVANGKLAEHWGLVDIDIMRMQLGGR